MMDVAKTIFVRDNALDDFQYYYYKPSMAAAVLFIALFGISSVLHIVQMSATKTWFMIPFVIGGIFETIGYVGRAIAASENPGPYTLAPYVMQSLLLLVAPALFAASIYMELGRIVLMVDGQQSLIIRRTWLTKIFVTGDVLSFLMQSSGAGMLTSGDSDKVDLGKTIVIAGLAAQLVIFGLFVVACALFHARNRKNPTPKSKGVPWQKHLVSMYLVSILIFVRSIVRVVEYAQGYDGYIRRHEVFLYGFDAAVMWQAMIVMNWIHPSEVAALLRGGKAFTNAWRLEDIGCSGASHV